jgi:hypothetical protein
LNLFQGNDWAMVAPRTAIGDFLPRLGRRYVRRPKRPSAALARTLFVDLATASLAIEENAIAAGQFDQAFSLADQTNVALLKIFRTDSKQSRHCLDFGLVDPNITRYSSATIAAPGALETQSLMIPGA